MGTSGEFAAFIANSIVFLLLGVRVHALASLLVKHSDLNVIAIVASLAGRPNSDNGVVRLFGCSKLKLGLRRQHVLVLGGLKETLSLALAIGPREGIPFREQIVAVTFGVVAFSVIVQGMTMPVLMRKLGLIG